MELRFAPGGLPLRAEGNVGDAPRDRLAKKRSRLFSLRAEKAGGRAGEAAVRRAAGRPRERAQKTKTRFVPGSLPLCAEGNVGDALRDGHAKKRIRPFSQRAENRKSDLWVRSLVGFFCFSSTRDAALTERSDAEKAPQGRIKARPLGSKAFSVMGAACFLCADRLQCAESNALKTAFV